MIIALVRSLYSLFPSIVARHWFFWVRCERVAFNSGCSNKANDPHETGPRQVHAFSAAVCLSMVIIVSPTSALANLALTELESVITLFTMVNATGAGRRMRMNLRWLQRLRAQAIAKMNAASAAAMTTTVASNGVHPTAGPEGSEDVALHVGWRTRLIQQGENRAKAAASSMHPYPNPSIPSAGLSMQIPDQLPPEEADLFANLDFDSAGFVSARVWARPLCASARLFCSPPGVASSSSNSCPCRFRTLFRCNRETHS
jgi:hypothetical protein